MSEVEVSIEYAVNGVIVRQTYPDGAPLVEVLSDNYKELIDKLGSIVWSELEFAESDKVNITIKIEEA